MLHLQTTKSMAYCSAFLLALLLFDEQRQGLFTVSAVRNLQIVSPLQSLTIWDSEAVGLGSDGSSEVPVTSYRGRFLPRFRAGLAGESKARKEFSAKQKKRLQQSAAAAGESSRSWATSAEASDRRAVDMEERAAEKAFDEAVQKFESEQAKLDQRKGKQVNENQYQFVGVVNPKTGGSAVEAPPITWYARKKPKNAKWSLRLVHVNREAILTDLFRRGKIDVFAKYDNISGSQPATGEASKQPLVTPKYSVRKRSWMNLWNFSPKHLFTDSSGMYWRERRLRPGLYTDGNTVYESSYRYRDGRNGMHRVSTFDKYLNSQSVDKSQKQKILKRLKEDTPDVVLED